MGKNAGQIWTDLDSGAQLGGFKRLPFRLFLYVQMQALFEPTASNIKQLLMKNQAYGPITCCS
jgi:hypothetical protein